MISKYKELKKKISESKYAVLIRGIIFSVVPIILMVLMQGFSEFSITLMRPMAVWFNIFIFELIAWILYILIGRARWALRIETVLALAFGLTSYYVMVFRSTPFVPWDIFSIRTAGSVAGNYSYMLPMSKLAIVIGFILVFAGIQLLDFRMEMKFYYRLIPFVLVSVVLCGFVRLLQNEDFQTKNRLYPFLFTPTVMIKYNGLAVTFAMDMAYVVVDKPSGYSQKEAIKTLDEYETAGASNSGENQDYPNIIVIMDEAFSDLSVLGGMATSQDVMPFVHSLQEGAEDTVTGKLNVSVCGGNTANTEFEFLTGNTMAFLPNGSIPYQQYITKDIPSLASHLKGLGYATYAQHPYNSTGWCRDTVYPKLGFDELAFVSDYSNRSYLRTYVDDKSDFNKIIETYENKPAGQPAFIFNVTMQNHGGYTDTYEDFENTVTVDGIESQALEQYLTLISITDQEFENLINYFKNVDEKTIVVFFGDHQPSDAVAANILAKNGKDYQNLSDEDTQKRYQVPYVVWANYDIEEGVDRDTSANYLAANVLKDAGLPTSDYQNFLLDLQEKYPVISGVYTEDNGSDEGGEMLQTYKKLQYYRLIDWKGDKN